MKRSPCKSRLFCDSPSHRVPSSRVLTLLASLTLLCLSPALAYAGGWQQSTTYSGSSSGHTYHPPAGPTGGTWGTSGENMTVSSTCDNSTNIPGSKVTSKSSGMITTVFTWVPDAGKTMQTDPPPKKVRIDEEAEAQWSWADEGAGSSGGVGDGEVAVVRLLRRKVPRLIPTPLLATFRTTAARYTVPVRAARRASVPSLTIPRPARLP